MAEGNLTVVETPSTLATSDPLMRCLGAERRIWLVEHSHPGRRARGTRTDSYHLERTVDHNRSLCAGTTALQASPGLTSGETSWRKY